MSFESSSIISVRDLVKEYTVSRRAEGFMGAVKYLFSRSYDTVRVVDQISFDIFPGELVGYIGKNGAGKSTTIKMLTGVLVPTEGQICVNGLVPHQRRAENGQNIGVVFGQRTQLKWDIPVIESFRLLKEIYGVKTAVYNRNMEIFADVLGIGNLLAMPVRKLSLGQRMKCDLAASFLHNPKIIYLDEPTIGLDILVKENIRTFIKTINAEQNTTIILTTHDLDDIESICRRAIIIDSGKIVYDGGIDAIKARFGKYKILNIEVKNNLHQDNTQTPFPNGATVLEMGEHHIKLQLNKEEVSIAVITKILIDRYDILDISMEETGIGSIVKQIYQDGWHDPTKQH
ncbi:MAG: sugar ABC transporter ATP-binding protein [Chloroflexi bacterium]|nr:MAG: sugar ABC transporter ATP-binding protein [Chloroflexota bacterium]